MSELIKVTDRPVLCTIAIPPPVQLVLSIDVTLYPGGHILWLVKVSSSFIQVSVSAHRS